jgi:hypothetical protein
MVSPLHDAYFLLFFVIHAKELARERLLIEEAKEQRQAAEELRFSQFKPNSVVSALVGASFGAGLGVVMAVIMGAASAFRKP